MYTPKQLHEKYKVSNETLRRWEIEGKLTAIKTKGGHRRYLINETTIQSLENTKRSIIYARVSSKKQEGDLQRQVEFLQQHYPEHEVVTDIGSGINFKRKGMLQVLDILLQRNLKELVVAHRDRLCRFGFPIFEHIFQACGSILTVLEDTSEDKSLEQELADDLMSIVTVFTARYHGSRKYKLADF